MGNILLSIIIPVFNVEKYLRKCLDSIVSQDTNNCEILLIDDGSTDGSSLLCDMYSKQYRFIHVYHKENGGLSDARNMGIRAALGDYLMFVDSDDYLEQGSISYFVEKIKAVKADVFVGKSYSVSESGGIIEEVQYSIKEGLYSRNDYFVQLYRHPKTVIFCAQYYICKKTIVNERGLLFKVGIIHEDELWTPLLLLNCETIYYCDIFFYYHLMRDGSIMHSNNDKKSGESLVAISNVLIKTYSDSQYSKINLRYLKNRLAVFYLQAFTKLGFVNSYVFDRKIPLRYSCYFASRIKSLLFLFSPHIFYRVWTIKNKKRMKIYD